MKPGIRWFAAVIGLSFLVLFSAGPGSADSTLETVQSGMLAMSSDAGDYIGQGRLYSFATPSNLFFARSDEGGSRITVTVRPDPVDTSYWSLEFAAPWGQQLVPGTYTNVERASSRSIGSAGLDINGEYRGCNRVAGSFTVLEARYEPSGYVDSFDATFEQHCEGATPALRGEVRVTNPPPPPPIAARLTIDDTATIGAHGAALVHGTVSCNRNPDPNMSTININLSEPTKKTNVIGSAAIALWNCPTTPVAWTATVTPQDPSLPFVKGSISITAWASLRDPFYGEYVYGAPIAANANPREG
jgi:hypothetical protein